MKLISGSQLRGHNALKSQTILDRKQATLEKVAAERHMAMTGKTMTVIINPVTKVADVFSFPGYHLRVGWNSG